MKLGIKILQSDSTLNNLVYSNQVEFYPGETITVMFQLVNELTGDRYIPSTAAVMSAKLYSVNADNNLTKTPSMVFPSDDRSIWSFSLNALDTQKLGGVNLELTLTEGTQIRKIWAKSVIVPYPRSPYQA